VPHVPCGSQSAKGVIVKRIAFVVLALAILVFPLTAAKAPDRPRSQVQLVEATIDQLQHALRTGLLTSEELVQMYLARIDKYESLVNAFIHVNQNAIEEARAIDDRRRRGHKTNPLFGIPVLLKDNIDTDDMPTTAGSPALAGSIPPHDAFITARLREAGAIILGKATLTEFANFISTNMPSGYSPLGGYGFNPYDPRPEPRAGLNDGRPVLTPGGSSSGSGIGVAANLVTVAVGTETSGSILSPGTANMAVGIKPTLGLVSRTGILPITADQDTAGPLARTVADAAALLGVIAGFDADDGATAPCLQPGNCFDDYTQFLDKHALRGARIAVPHVPYWNGLTTDQRAVLNNAIAALRAEGAFVADPYEIPNQADISAFGICTSFPAPTTCSTVLMYGQKHDLNAYMTGRPNAPVHTLLDIINFNLANPALTLKYNQDIFLAAQQLNVNPGSPDTIRYQQDRQKDLQLTRGGLDAVFNGPDGVEGTADDFDAILFPRNGGAAAPAKAGYPSIVVPGGFAPVPTTYPPGFVAEPAPFGITFTGRAFSEPLLIGIGYAFEQATLHRVPPKSTPALPSDFVERPVK
jgi:amidase